MKQGLSNIYVKIKRQTLQDDSLSWKAKGLLAYLLSLPADWNIVLDEIQNHSIDGRDSLYSGINELIASGYLKRKRVVNENGQFFGYEYTLFSTPPCTGKPFTEKPYKNILLRNIINNKNSFARKYAKKLMDELLAKNKVSKGDINKWTKEIIKLKAEVGKSRLKEVLLWYIRHFTDKYTPKAYTAKTFREKFYNIEDAMNRSGGNITKVKISDTATKITAQLQDRPWPKITTQQLSEAIQISLDRLKVFVNKQKSWQEKNPKHKYFNFSEVVLQEMDNSVFIKRWFKGVNDRIKNWNDWSGELKGFLFSEDSKQLLLLGRNLAISFCGDSQRWDKYIETLK